MIEFLFPVCWSVGYLIVGTLVILIVLKINGKPTHNLDVGPFFLSVCLWPIVIILFLVIRIPIYVGKNVFAFFRWAIHKFKNESDKVEKVDPQNFQLHEMPMTNPPNLPTPPPIEEWMESAVAIPSGPSPSTVLSVEPPKEEPKIKVLIKDITLRFKFMDL